MSGYLFAFFSGEEEQNGEQIRFALSRDGLYWEDLHAGRAVLRSDRGTGGCRDPFLVRDPRNNRCYLLATDLKIEGGASWQRAKRFGSRGLLVWESDDLICWEGPELRRIAPPDAGCLWAPEAVYDRAGEDFFVFFASWMGNRITGIGKQKIYSVRTRDFRTFSKPELYIERKDDVIDTTIVECEGKYFRISKNETSKKLILEKGNRLDGEFTQIHSEVLERLNGVEGPECFRLPDGRWCLIADRYSRHSGYFPMIAEDLGSGCFSLPQADSYNMGEKRKRHGGVLELTDGEYERLAAWGLSKNKEDGKCLQ